MLPPPPRVPYSYMAHLIMYKPGWDNIHWLQTKIFLPPDIEVVLPLSCRKEIKSIFSHCQCKTQKYSTHFWVPTKHIETTSRVRAGNSLCREMMEPCMWLLLYCILVFARCWLVAGSWVMILIVKLTTRDCSTLCMFILPAIHCLYWVCSAAHIVSTMVNRYPGT